MDKENQTLKIRKRIEKLKSSVTGEVGCSVVLHYVVCLFGNFLVRESAKIIDHPASLHIAFKLKPS